MTSGSKSGHLEDQAASGITLRCMLDREMCVNERWIKPAQSSVCDGSRSRYYQGLQQISKLLHFPLPANLSDQTFP